MQAIKLGTSSSRARMLTHALRVEYLTVRWNVIEGVVAIAAALAAGSVALLAFGIDSFVECASGGILIWRLRAERSAQHAAAIKRLDRRAHQLVGWSLFALAAWVVFDAATALYKQEHPEPSTVGLVLLVLSSRRCTGSRGRSVARRQRLKVARSWPTPSRPRHVSGCP